MPNLTVAIQNAVERHEMGSATSVSGFMRSLGGALGVALAGTVLALRLQHFLPAAWVAAEGGTHSILQLGVQQIAQLSPDQRHTLMEAYRHSIATTFLTGASIAALAFAVVLFLPERPLRSTAPEPAEEQKTAEALG
jgi:hypothetical protein